MIFIEWYKIHCAYWPCNTYIPYDKQRCKSKVNWTGTSEFDFEVKDRKGIKNQVAKHLSSLGYEEMIKLGDDLEIDDILQNEQVLVASKDLIP